MNHTPLYSLCSCLPLIALLGTSLRAAPPEEIQLLAKYDFESPASLKDWTGEHDGTYKAAISWKKDRSSAIAPLVMELTEMDTHSGSGALAVGFIADPESGSMSAITPSILVPVKAGRSRTLIIRGFAKVTGGKDASIELRALQRNAENKPTKWLDDTKTLAVIRASTDWQEFRVEGEALADTRSISLMFVNTGSLGQGRSPSSLELDDLTVEMK